MNYQNLKSESFSAAINLLNQSKWEQAAILLRQINSVFQDYESKKLLAVCCYANKKIEEAIRLNLELLAIQTNDEVSNNLAACYIELGENDAAIEILVGLPESQIHFSNLGLAYRRKQNIPDAIRCLSQAPNDENALINLAGCYTEILELDKAKQCLLQVLASNPNSAAAHLDLGLILLLQGDWDQGWKEYQWRFKYYDHLKKYDLSKKCDEPIHIVCEQGIGDIFNFIRFVPKSATINAPPELQDFLKANGFNTQETSGKWCSILDLPKILGLTQQDIKNSYTPYLQSTQQLDLNSNKLKVGIVWAGNPKHPNDFKRSCHLKHFEKLIHKDIQFYSLQHELAPRFWPNHGVVDLMEGSEMPMIDLRPFMNTWDQTAAAIEAMDLIISVDTSILHLAGAIGKKTYGLLPYLPDFRWGLTENIWYPNVKLLRQPTPHQWKPVFEMLSSLCLI